MPGFSAIRDYLARRRVAKTFSGLVSKEAMDYILSTENKPLLRQADIEYVLIAVRDDNLEQALQHVARVCDIAVEHHANVDTILSSMVVACYGMFPHQTENAHNKYTFIETLQKELQNNIKIVHGKAHGYFGDIGGEIRRSFTFIVPHFVDALGLLSTIHFGEIQEFSYVRSDQ